jgi:hypothetical protein
LKQGALTGLKAFTLRLQTYEPFFDCFKLSLDIYHPHTVSVVTNMQPRTDRARIDMEINVAEACCVMQR